MLTVVSGVLNLGIWCPLLCGRRLTVTHNKRALLTRMRMGQGGDLSGPVAKLEDWVPRSCYRAQTVQVDQIVGKSYEYNIPKIGALLLLRELQVHPHHRRLTRPRSMLGSAGRSFNLNNQTAFHVQSWVRSTHTART